MNPVLIRAVAVVTLALVFYSIAIIMEQKKKSVSVAVLVFLTLGVCADIASTTLMIIGSNNIPVTVHGFLGYSALMLMLIDGVLIWKFWLKNHGSGENHAGRVPASLHLYTRIAYIWWVVAYVAGAVIAMVM